MGKEELNHDEIMSINETVNDILLFIDKEYETIKVKDSLWEYDKEDIKKEDMIFPTNLCEKIEEYLILKLTELKGEE